MKKVSKFPSKEIQMPEKIVIALPFEKAETLTELRAVSEKTTNFRNVEEAKVCTLSFAASELSKYLKLLAKVKTEYIQIGKKTDGFVIEISAGDADKVDGTYTISPIQNGVSISGNGRAGALYGVYAFLNEQGIRWYYPGKEGEEIPADNNTLAIPVESTTSSPDVEFRCLDLYQPLKDSAQFLYWMARNRMNCITAHHYTSSLGMKLCMTYRGIGGHLFDTLLQPDTPLSDGRTIWEAHPEWYGLPPEGERIKEKVLKRQFCFSQPELIDYLSNAIIEKLRTDWSDVDRIDIMGFDAGPDHACCCEECKKLGNDSDKSLYLLSEIRKRIDNAEGLQPITLMGCAYDATRTIEPPSLPVPENIKHDFMNYSPIQRCYKHDLDDPECSTNRYYYEMIKGWTSDKNNIEMGFCDYYNLSRYEDLPLIHRKRIKHDIPLYHKMGIKYVTHMHPALYNWGVRALNYLLIAEITWDTEVDADAIENEFFERLYGEYAEELKAIYNLMEQSTEHISSYRCHWSSALDVLQTWAGGDPIKDQLDRSGHFPDNNDLLVRMEADLKCSKEALSRIEAVIEKAKRNMVMEIGYTDEAIYTLVNAFVLKNRIIPRFQELMRSFIWGTDELELMTLFTKEYLLAQKGENDPELWEQIEKVYNKLSSYFYPHKYITQEVEAYCEDALTRSTLRGNVDMRRLYKIKTGQIK